MPAKRKPSGARAIDVHAHFYPEAYLKSLIEQGGPSGSRFERSASGAPVRYESGAAVELDATYWDVDKRVKRMDTANVQVHALSLTGPMVHWAPPERGAELARIVNDAMIQAHTAYPDRFVGCATLPLQEPSLALKELERVKDARAIRGVYFPTNVGGRELGDPGFFPIYERCEALRLPVLLHPVVVIGADRLGKYYLRNFLGNPFDTAVASANIVFGGVLDRFPRLDIVLPHGGGAMPYLMGRLTHGQRVRPETKKVAKKPFAQYLRRFHYDTITHSPELLRFLVGLVGPDRVMLGSDYCFDMGYQRPRDIIQSLRLSSADRDRIFGGNAARLLRI